MFNQSDENMQNIYLSFYDDEVEQEFSNQNYENQSENQDFVMNLFSEPQFKSAAQPTAFRTDEIQEKNSKDDKITNEVQIFRKNIEVNSITILKHSLALSKNNLKTANLNKFLRTKTISHLRILKRGHLLTEEENQAFILYEKVSISQQNNQKLFNVGSIKEKCYKFYHSSKLIKDLFASKASFQRKITIMKTLQRIGAKKKQLKIQQQQQQKGDYNKQVLIKSSEFN